MSAAAKAKPGPHKRGWNSGQLSWFDGSGPEAEIIVSTRVRVARNLAGHSFPRRAPLRERSEIYRKISDALSGLKRPGGAFTTVNFAQTSALDQQYFVEQRIASPDLQTAEGDRGVAYDAAPSVSVLINEDDHVRLQCLDSGCRPFDTWKMVDQLDEQLGRALDFAYDRRKGFLTSCPSNSGTGLRVSFLMHLPGLILTRSVDAVLQGASQMGIAARGFFGEHSAVAGSFFLLSNRAGMGANENDFLVGTQRTVEEVLGCERESRTRLLKDAKLELTDKVYRAYGILLQARTLSITEYLNLSSALRLGIDCGLFTECSTADLNRAQILVMPAHLQKQAGKEMDDRECSVMRAELTRKLLFKKRLVKVKKSMRE
jgi:protein arginine kinase